MEKPDMHEPNIVVIGGGNGTSTLLRGLREFTPNLTAIVAMADDGGSTGLLRDELGILPPGDARQCLIALSASPEMAELFGYRFDVGSLEGHNFGNIFLAAAARQTGSFEKALEIGEEALRVKGHVLPVTTDISKLMLQDGDQVIEGEDTINGATLTSPDIPKVWLEPNAHLHESAAEAIERADLVVIAPGLLYCSTASVLLIDGMKEALKDTKAPVVYTSNLVNIPRHTPDFKVQDYVRVVERLIGVEVLDYVLYSTNLPNAEYLRNQETGVEFDAHDPENERYTYVGAPLVSDKPAPVNPSDKIAHTRASVRHDSRATARALMQLYAHINSPDQ